MACRRALLVAAVAAASAADHPAVDEELAPTVMLQMAVALEHAQGASGNAQLPGDPPLDQMAKAGADGAAAWPIWPAEAPGRMPTDGPEYTRPVNQDDPVFIACVGFQLSHGFPKEYFDQPWTYNVAEPRILPFVVPRDAPNRKDAAVLIAPGGGGRFLSIANEGRDYALWLNSLGISAFVLVYRTSLAEDSFSSASMDAQRAMSIVRSRAATLGFNASRIGVIGSSFGGGLAAAVSTAGQRHYPRVDAVDDVSFRPDFALVVYGGYRGVPAPKEVRRAPHTFVVLAQDDPCAGLGGVQYWRALHELGAPKSELHVFDSGQHGFGLCLRAPQVWERATRSVCGWPKLARKFIENIALDWGWEATVSDLEQWATVDPVFVKELTAESKTKRALEIAARESRR